MTIRFHIRPTGWMNLAAFVAVLVTAVLLISAFGIDPMAVNAATGLVAAYSASRVSAGRRARRRARR